MLVIFTFSTDYEGSDTEAVGAEICIYIIVENTEDNFGLCG